MSNKVTLLRKISPGTINNVKKGFKGITEKQLVMRIFGIVSGVKAGEHPQFGAFYEFTGEFRAINADGEESAAPRAFLPSPVDAMLKDAWENGGKGNVQFGFDIFVVPDEGSERGYQYRVESLMESKPSDPLAALMAGLPPPALKAKQAALPGTEAGAEAVQDSTATTAEAAPAPAAGKGKAK